MVKTQLLTIIFMFSLLLLYPVNSFSQSHEDSHIIEHRVEPGDNLHLLAAYYLNNARRWREIYEKNRENIPDPNILEVGMILKIPVIKRDWKPKFPIHLWRKIKKD